MRPVARLSSRPPRRYTLSAQTLSIVGEHLTLVSEEPWRRVSITQRSESKDDRQTNDDPTLSIVKSMTHVIILTLNPVPVTLKVRVVPSGIAGTKTYSTQ